MYFSSWLHNRYRTPGFLVNSLPKAGTNLLAKALSLFPGVRTDYTDVPHLDHPVWQRWQRPGDTTELAAPVTVTWPRFVPLRTCRRVLRQIPRGGYFSAHMPYSPQMAALIESLGIKTVLILRDPRDVAVSAARFIPQLPYHPFYALYEPLSESDRLLLTIRGHQPRRPGEPHLLNIADACRSVLGWNQHAFNYTTYFHRLVGPQGDGSRAAQLEELENIAMHLGLHSSRRQLEHIAEKTFGGTHTFRQGTSGSWRKYFSAEHRAAFQQVAGPLLAELGFEDGQDC